MRVGADLPRELAVSCGRRWTFESIRENRAMATKKPKGLGLGLEALLGPTVRDPPPDARQARRGTPTPHTLSLDDLQPGKYQPRTRMDEGALLELAESIKAQGIMQPVLVRRIDGGGRFPADAQASGRAPRYEVIAGERRVRAARLAGLTEVPVLVREVPDEAAAAMALIENIQREDLNPLEEAQGLKRLTDEFGLTHEEAARSVGRSRSAATNLLRLLNLADPVQQLLLAGDLDMGHARALLALEGAEQILVANEVVARKLSVRDAELARHASKQRARSTDATAAHATREAARSSYASNRRCRMRSPPRSTSASRSARDAANKARSRFSSGRWTNSTDCSRSSDCRRAEGVGFASEVARVPPAGAHIWGGRRSAMSRARAHRVLHLNGGLVRHKDLLQSGVLRATPFAKLHT